MNRTRSRSRLTTIGLGFSQAFFSSLGQTFFISLFVPSLYAHFKLSSTSFGSLYSGATLASALFLPYLGKKIDSADLRAYVLLTGLGIFLSYIALSFTNSLVVLALCLFLQRLCGQGLMSHISATVVAKKISHLRGRALGVSALGFPVGEAIWPPIITICMSLYDWRITLGGLALCFGLAYFPMMLFLVPRGRGSSAESTQSPSGLANQGTPVRRSIPSTTYLKSKYFWLIAPYLMVPPFFLTGFFFHQGLLAEEMGWSMTWLGSSFIFFAGSRIVSSYAAGVLVDHIGSQLMFVLGNLPLFTAVLLLTTFSNTWLAPVYLGLAGLSAGTLGTVKTALLADKYGTESLGGIRSLLTTFSVLATALSPALLGYALDVGWTWSLIMKAAAVAIGVTFLLALLSQRVPAVVPGPDLNSGAR